LCRDFSVVRPGKNFSPARSFNSPGAVPAATIFFYGQSSKRSCSFGSRAATFEWWDQERTSRRRDLSIWLAIQPAQMLAKANTIQETKELKDLGLSPAEWARRKGLGKRAYQAA